MAEDTTTAEFILRLKNEISGSAASAAQALSNLKSEMEADQKALADMEKAMRNLKKAATVDEGAMRTLTEAMNTKREAIARAQAAYVELGGEFGRAKAKGGDLISRLKALESETQALPGPLAQVTASLSKLAQLAGGAGWLALAAGLAAVAAAAVYAAKTLLELGLANADARRNELLHLEALTKMRNWFGILPGNAKQMLKGIDEISTRVSISREEVAQFNDTLYRSGLRGASLKTALEATAIKASALGTQAGNAFAGMAAHANRMGVSVNRLAQDVKNRFGGIVAKQMLSLQVQSKKQKEAFAAMFTDLRIDPLLGALADVRKLLSQNTEQGQALKHLFTALVQPLIDGVTKALPYLELFFDGIIEGALDIEIAFLQVRNWWIKTFGPSQKATTEDYMAAFELGRTLVVGFAAAVTATAILLTGKFLLSVTTMSVQFVAAMVRMGAAATAQVLRVIVPAFVSLAGGITTTSGAITTLSVTQIPQLVKALGTTLLGSITSMGAAIAGFATTVWTSFTAVVIPAITSAIASFAALAVEVIAVATPFLLAAAALWGLYKIFELFYVIWREVDWSELGQAIWKGIVEGITSGWKFIKDAMSNLAEGAWNAFTGALKIGSPSKVFADLGVEIPKGVEQGVTQGTPEAQSAVDEMITVPSVPSAPAAAGPGAESPLAAAGSASGGSATITIGEIVIHTSSDKPRELAQAFRRELESVLEGVALQMGARIAGAT